MVREMEYKGKNILVFGAGLSGVAAARLLVDLSPNKIILADDKSSEKVKADGLGELKLIGVELRFGDFTMDILNDIDLFVISPGVPRTNLLIQKAVEKNIPIIGEFELGMELAKCPVIAITGTNGKTTSVSLIDEIFKNSKDYISELVGNINRPVTQIVRTMPKDSSKYVFVAEVSSFQLETVKEFKPKIAAILNFTPDHLNRYDSFQHYIDAKVRITENQDEDDYLILNYDDMHCREIAPRSKAKIFYFSRKSEIKQGMFVRYGQIMFAQGDGSKPIYICNVHDIMLMGAHNLENVLASAMACLLFGLNVNTISDAIRNFKGVEHRIDFTAEKNGVRYYNDSKSTNVDSLKKALLSFDQPIILIAGGRDKNSDYDSLTQIIVEKVKKAVLIGEARDRMFRAWGKKVDCTYAKDMKEAVEISSEASRTGDIILLSPACASFDMYNNFEDRGHDFVKQVHDLI